jgi:hypothetical protein
MTESDTFTMAEEFADVDFNEERLEKRFRKTMETLAKDPRKSIDLFKNHLNFSVIIYKTTNQGHS